MRYIPIAVLTLLVIHVYGQHKSIQTEPGIRRVMVYQQGAQVERRSIVSLPAGKSEIRVSDLSPEINQQSIQVNMHPDVRILSINHQVNHLRVQLLLEEIRELNRKDSLLKDRLELEQTMLQVYKQEETMLQKNQDIRGNQGIRNTDLREAIDYLRSKMTEILRKQLDTQRTISELESERKKIARQSAETGQASSRSTSDLVISVTTAKAMESSFALKYLVEKARWIPVYDIRVKNISSPIEIVQKAQIEQQTGESWKEVSLVLSTGNPQETATKPTLHTWYLTYQQPRLVLRGASTMIDGLAGRAPGLASNQMQEVVVVGYGKSRDATSSDEELPAPRTLQLPAEISAQTITLQYEIKEPFTVPNDGKMYTTDIQHIEVPASFEYYAAPKINPAVFLTAHIAQWEALNLVSGETNLFFEGSFLGRSQLSTENTGDTLSLSLGQDKSVQLQRKKITDFTGKKLIGNHRVDTRGFEITIRNTKADSIQLILEDQVPVSTEKEIEVDVDELTGGKRDDKTGVVRWNLSLAPRQENRKVLGYRVRHPRDKSLILE